MADEKTNPDEGLTNAALAAHLRDLARERAAAARTPFWGNYSEAIAARRLESASERNEHTSPDIASHAARIIAMDDAQVMTLALQNPELIRRVAASALTQAEDRVSASGPSEQPDAQTSPQEGPTPKPEAE